MSFGQAVIGPPGSGKSTYCGVMKTHLEKLGRNVFVVNLDPGNEEVGYKCAVDVRQLISVDEVMDTLDLGPNGALLYAMQYLETNFDWLQTHLNAQCVSDKHKSDDPPKPPYLILDFPGQVELFTAGDSVKKLLKKLEKWGMRLVTVNLTDSLYCADPAKFISTVLTCLSTMINLETPHINVLSKVDLLLRNKQLPFDLEFFSEVLDLRRLIDMMTDDAFMDKHKKLTERLTEVIQNYGLVSYIPIHITDERSLAVLLSEVDKANGYCFGMEEMTIRTMMECAMTDSTRKDYIQTMKEKYFQT